MEQERYEEAETWLRLAGDARAREFSASHPGTLVVQGNLALIRFRQERYAEAETILRGVLAEQEKREPDLHLAAQNALRGMIEWLSVRYRITPEEAYMLSSVAVDLRISEVVDAPNWVVSACFPLDLVSAAG